MIVQWLSLAVLLGQLCSQTYYLGTGDRVTHAWMETGFVYVNDYEWSTVHSAGHAYERPVIFTALPDLGGALYTQGFPTSTRIQILSSSGNVSFKVKLYQPNDSYCSKQWYIPQAINPDVQIGWAIAEYGAYNVTGKYIFLIGTGLVNRTHQQLTAATTMEFHQLFYPAECGPYLNTTCAFPQSYLLSELGAIGTIQSLVHDTYLLLRVQYQNRRYLRMVLHPHDANSTSYFSQFETPETVAFMAFRTGLALDCVERMTFETKRWVGVTSNKLYYPYHFQYLQTPGVFGLLITQASLVDAAALRVFSRTDKDAYVIIQEDYCDGNDPVHTTKENASALVVGETQNGHDLCDVIYQAITVAPTPAPTPAPCVYNFLLYDLFGDGWQNIELSVETDGTTMTYQAQCSCRMVQVVSRSCHLVINMVHDGEPIAPWEPLWGTVVGGQTWVGDFGTTMTIDHESVVVVNGPDVDPNSLDNQCKACTPAPVDNDGGNGGGPPGRGNGGPGRGRGNDDGAGRGNGAGVGRGNDDGAGRGNGAGNDDGKGNNDCNGKNSKKCDDKRKLNAGDDGNHGTGMAPFTIYDQFGNGWYAGGQSSGVCDSDLCANNDDMCVAETVDLPDILTYPKWYVMNAARTELVDFGSMCENPKGIEGCVITLPDGRYVFRVAGYNLPGDLASWRFCGIYGVNHQELQFQMVNGNCVPHALLAAEDYCTGFKTLMVLHGTLQIAGVTDANINDYDTNAIYLQLLAMFPKTLAVGIESETLSGGVLSVAFWVKVSPEDTYGLDGSVSTNIDTCLNAVYATAQSESQTSFLSGLSSSILSSPFGAQDPLAHVNGVTLSSLEVVQVQYVSKDDNTVLHPLDIVTSSPSETTQNGVSIMTIVALVCGAVFMAAATIFALTRGRTSTHAPLSDKSSHLDSSINKVSVGTSLDIEK